MLEFDRILIKNNDFKELESLELTKVGNDFLNCNKSLITLNLPKLTEVGHGFLHYHPTKSTFLEQISKKNKLKEQ